MSQIAANSDPDGAPLDLVGLALVGAWVLVQPVLGPGGAVQVVFGLVAVLFAPGYALVAALFPRTVRQRELKSDWMRGSRSGDTESLRLSGVERVVLAVGLSVCLVPLLGLGLEFTAWPIQRRTLLAAVGGVTLALTAVAALRRWQVPASSRFTVSLRFPRIGEDWGLGGSSGGSVTGLNALLAGMLILATAGVGVAAWQPTANQTEQFSEFFLQTRDPGTGDFVAGNYRNVSADPGDPLYLGITNQEGERANYTVVTEVHKISQTADGRVIVEERELDRLTITVAPGETERRRHTVDREFSGRNLRLTYLLYIGEPPEEPTVENAYRRVHVWVGDGS